MTTSQLRFLLSGVCLLSALCAQARADEPAVQVIEFDDRPAPLPPSQHTVVEAPPATGGTVLVPPTQTVEFYGERPRIHATHGYTSAIGALGVAVANPKGGPVGLNGGGALSGAFEVKDPNGSWFTSGIGNLGLTLAPWGSALSMDLAAGKMLGKGFIKGACRSQVGGALDATEVSSQSASAWTSGLDNKQTIALGKAGVQLRGGLICDFGRVLDYLTVSGLVEAGGHITGEQTDRALSVGGNVTAVHGMFWDNNTGVMLSSSLTTPLISSDHESGLDWSSIIAAKLKKPNLFAGVDVLVETTQGSRAGTALMLTVGR